jgi:hypothetical protein
VRRRERVVGGFGLVVVVVLVEGADEGEREVVGGGGGGVGVGKADPLAWGTLGLCVAVVVVRKCGDVCRLPLLLFPLGMIGLAVKSDATDEEEEDGVRLASAYWEDRPFGRGVRGTAV